MTDNHIQIFSLKSNLISNAKNDQLILESRKNESQSRAKNSYLDKMFQTVQHHIKLKQKFILQDSIQNQKENSGLAIEIRKFRAAYDHQTPLIAEPLKTNFIQSRSFLIRSHHQKKPTISSSNLKNNQSISLRKEASIIGFHIPSKYYNFQSANGIKINPILKIRKNVIQHTQPKLAIFIPFQIIKQSIYICKQRVQKLLQSLVLQKIEVYLIITDKQDLEHINGELQRNCHIIYVEFKEKYTFKQIFLDLSSQQFSQLPLNLLFFQQRFPKIGNKLYFPYFNQLSDKIFDSQMIRRRYGFVKIANIQNIKSIQLVSDLYIKINIFTLAKKQLKLREQRYNLIEQVKLELKQKKTLLSKNQSKLAENLSYVNQRQLQIMQQKLSEYSNTIKTKREQLSNSKKVNQKCGRRSLVAKTSYQIIDQLIKNNIHISKQIGDYISFYKKPNQITQPIICDNPIFNVIQ